MSKLIKFTRSRTNLIQSFLSKYSPNSIPSSASTSTGTIPLPYASTSTLLSNPFYPSKTPGSNSSSGPKYSIRRQKILIKQCKELNWPLNVLPPSYIKPTKQSLRLSSSSSSSSTSVPSIGERTVKLSIGSSNYQSVKHIPSTKILDLLNLEKKGPYLGRKGPAFKGKIWERKFSARQEELKVALLKAPAKEAAWRKGLADDKLKSRPSIPF